MLMKVFFVELGTDSKNFRDHVRSIWENIMRFFKNIIFKNFYVQFCEYEKNISYTHANHAYKIHKRMIGVRITVISAWLACLYDSHAYDRRACTTYGSYMYD